MHGANPRETAENSAPERSVHHASSNERFDFAIIKGMPAGFP